MIIIRLLERTEAKAGKSVKAYFWYIEQKKKKEKQTNKKQWVLSQVAVVKQ